MDSARLKSPCTSVDSRARLDEERYDAKDVDQWSCKYWQICIREFLSMQVEIRF